MNILNKHKRSFSPGRSASTAIQRGHVLHQRCLDAIANPRSVANPEKGVSTEFAQFAAAIDCDALQGLVPAL